MADSSVSITAGSGTAIDTQVPSGGEHRQVVVLGSPSTVANVAEVSAAGAVLMQGHQGSRNSYSVTATGNSGALACTNYNLATVIVSGTYAGVTLVFEGSDDGGTTWVAIQGVRTDLFVAENTSGSLTNTTRGWDIPVGAFTHFRVRASTWTSGTAAVGISFQSMPYEPSPTVGLSGMFMGRTQKGWWANAVTAGTTATEAAVTLTTSSSPGAATTTGSSFVIPAGKRFLINSIMFASRGNSTATAHTITFSLRVNTGGAVTTTSPVIWTGFTGAGATALAWDRVGPFELPGGIEIVGDGTAQWGLTVNPTFVTNAPTYYAAISGFEY